MVDFSWYKTFYYVAKNMSITKASEELFVTQPAISITIKNLEESLGCKLFVRTRAGLSFTSEGINLYNQIAPSCRVLIETEAIMGKFSKLEAGTVKISSTEMGIDVYISPVIEYFHKNYPKIDFVIKKVSHHKIFEALESEEIDFAVDIYPDTQNEIITNLKSINWNLKNLEEYCLLRTEDLAVVGSQFKYLTKKTYDIEELVNYPLILPDHNDYAYSYYTKLFTSRGVECHANFEIAQFLSRLALTQRNMGISFMPYDKIKQDIGDGSLYVIKVRQPLMKRKVVLLMVKHKLLGSASRKFKEIMLKTSAEQSHC
jgi:DNA-binding transcriptional LysR family regulator